MSSYLENNLRGQLEIWKESYRSEYEIYDRETDSPYWRGRLDTLKTMIECIEYLINPKEKICGKITTDGK